MTLSACFSFTVHPKCLKNHWMCCFYLWIMNVAVWLKMSLCFEFLWTFWTLIFCRASIFLVLCWIVKYYAVAYLQFWMHSFFQQNGFKDDDSETTTCIADDWCQFYQRLTHAFFVRNFDAKNFKALFWL